MRKFALIFIFIILLGPPANALAQDTDLNQFPPDIRALYEKKKLVVGMYHADVMPMFFHNKKGEMIGYDVEIARAMGRELGVDVEFNRSPKTFDEVVAITARHEADLGISLVSATLRRALRVNFSEPYLVLHPTLTVNRLNAARYHITKDDPLRELRQTNQKIGVKAGTSYVVFARELFPKAEIVEYKDWDDAMDAAYYRKVLAVLRDEIGVKNFIYQRPELSVNLQIVPLQNRVDPIGVVVPSDSPHLLEWVNGFLKRHYPKPSVDSIFHRYEDYYVGLQ